MFCSPDASLRCRCPSLLPPCPCSQGPPAHAVQHLTMKHRWVVRAITLYGQAYPSGEHHDACCKHQLSLPVGIVHHLLLC